MRHYCTALAYHAVSLLQRSYWETHRSTYYNKKHVKQHHNIAIAVKSRLFFFVTEIYKIHVQSNQNWLDLREIHTKKCVCVININCRLDFLFKLYIFFCVGFCFKNSFLVYTHMYLYEMKSWIKNCSGKVTTTWNGILAFIQQKSISWQKCYMENFWMEILQYPIWKHWWPSDGQFYKIWKENCNNFSFAVNGMNVFFSCVCAFHSLNKKVYVT